MKQILVVRKGEIISARAQVASSLFERIVGLLNRSGLDPDEALLLEPCQSVHTFFMRFPIDVVFLDKENTVLGVSHLKPWRISKHYFRAHAVLEAPLGFCNKHQVENGQKLEIRHV